MSNFRISTVPLRQGICASATDTGTSLETGNPVLDMANMLGIPRKPTAAAALPGGKDLPHLTLRTIILLLCIFYME
jgi:hypothetical protein